MSLRRYESEDDEEYRGIKSKTIIDKDIRIDINQRERHAGTATYTVVLTNTKLNKELVSYLAVVDTRHGGFGLNRTSKGIPPDGVFDYVLKQVSKALDEPVIKEGTQTGLRRRSYLVESDRFEKKQVVWKSAVGSTPKEVLSGKSMKERKVEAYVMGHVGVARGLIANEKSWVPFVIPISKTVGTFPKLERAKKMAVAVYTLIDKNGNAKSSKLGMNHFDILGLYYKYLNGNGKDDYPEWIKDNEAEIKKEISDFYKK
jgi:hypothetical protein